MQDYESFYLYLLRQRNNKDTAKQSYETIKRLAKTIGLNRTEIDKYLLDKYLNGANTNGLNKTIGVLRHWGRFTQDQSLQELKYFKPTIKNKAILSDEEIKQILELPKPHNCNKVSYYKYTLFLKLLAYSGMRGSEVATLMVAQIDFGRQVFILDHTKTTPRLVPIAPILIPELKEYIKKLEGQHLFIINGHLTNKMLWWAHFKVRLKRCGITRPGVSLHSLRHSFITRMLEEDSVNMFTLQLAVGHKEASTTQKYYHLTTKNLTNMITKDPLGRNTLPYEERFKQFRTGVRKLLSELSFTIEEEKQMLKDIY